MAKRSRRRNSAQPSQGTSPPTAPTPSTPSSPHRPLSERPSPVSGSPIALAGPGKPWLPSLSWTQHPSVPEPRAPRLGTFPIPSPTFSHQRPCSPSMSSVPPSRDVSPSRSIVSFATVDSGESDAHTKASVVTSISIPASATSPRAQVPVRPSISSPSQSFQAPIPKRLSSLSGLSLKPKRHSQFYFNDDLVTLNVRTSRLLAMGLCRIFD
jgi:hypothetical protein